MVRKVQIVQRRNVVGQRTTNYVVASADEQTVTLRPMGVAGRLGAVTLPRTQIASTRFTAGLYWVETTGGRVYKVLHGFRSEQRTLTEEALTGQVRERPQRQPRPVEQQAQRGWVQRNLDPNPPPLPQQPAPNGWGQLAARGAEIRQAKAAAKLEAKQAKRDAKAAKKQAKADAKHAPTVPPWEPPLTGAMRVENEHHAK